METFYTKLALLKAPVKINGKPIRLHDDADYVLPDAALAVMRRLTVPEGCPFVLRADGSYDEELSGFFLHLASGHSQSRGTWKQYAQHISMFVDFMAEDGMSWKDAADDDMDAYHRLRIDDHSIGESAWNVGVAALNRLYKWAKNQKLVDSVPWVARWSKGGDDSGAPYKHVKSKNIRFITYAQFKELLAAFRRSARGSPVRTGERNIIFAELLRQTGMRVGEACQIPFTGAFALPDPLLIRNKSRRVLDFHLLAHWTKGCKPRTIEIPRGVILDARRYSEEDRLLWVSRAKTKVRSYHEPNRLWLNEDALPMTPDAWNQVFARASQICGFKVTPHSLRHMFAVFTLSAMIKKVISINEFRRSLKDIETSADMYNQVIGDPLRKLQRLMGHSDPETTRGYLDVIKQQKNIVDDAVAEWGEASVDPDLLLPPEFLHKGDSHGAQ